MCSWVENIFLTKSARPFKVPKFPQAAIVMSDCITAFFSHESFSGPTGSEAPVNARGSVLRYANRLTTIRVEAPHCPAKLIQREIVGSLLLASAVDGFKPMNVTFLPVGAIVRDSQ